MDKLLFTKITAYIKIDVTISQLTSALTCVVCVCTTIAARCVRRVEAHCHCPLRFRYFAPSPADLVSLYSQRHGVVVNGFCNRRSTDPGSSCGTLDTPMVEGGGAVQVVVSGGAWELTIFTCIVFSALVCLVVRVRRSPALLFLSRPWFPPPPRPRSFLNRPPPFVVSTEARCSRHTPLGGALAGHHPDAGDHPRHQHPAATTAGRRGGGGGGHRCLDGGAENQGGALGVWAGCALMPACAVAAVRWLSRCGCRGTWAPAMLHRLALGVLPVPTVGSPRALGFAVLHANALAFGTTSCSLLEWCGYGLLVGALQAVNPTDLTVTPSYGDPNGSHVSYVSCSLMPRMSAAADVLLVAASLYRVTARAPPACLAWWTSAPCPITSSPCPNLSNVLALACCPLFFFSRASPTCLSRVSQHQGRVGDV